MSGLRTLRRSIAKHEGKPLRRGLERGTTGEIKGPARTPSREEVRQAERRALKAKKAREAASTDEPKAA